MSLLWFGFGFGFGFGFRSLLSLLAALRLTNAPLCFSNPAERYGLSADVYSFAITMYELADRALPFTRNERDSAVQLGVKIALEVGDGGLSIKPCHISRSAYCVTNRTKTRPRATDLRFATPGARPLR